MSKSTSRSATPTSRIIRELSSYTPSPTLPALVPSANSLLHLRAILTGAALPASSGYRHGRWLLSISLPPQYPNQPPRITFVTRVCHPNVQWETGEICLDVLKERWTPVLGTVGALECVGRLLGEPGTESPLGVEVAALMREGDAVGARGLVGFWCEEERFEGELEGDDGERKVGGGERMG